MFRHHMLKLGLALLMGLAFALPTAPAALAAPPANDYFADATLIDLTGPSFADVVDITEATLEDGEPLPCGMAKSVWYRLDPTLDATLRVNLDGSDFSDTVLTIWQGTESGLDYVSCGSWGPTITFFAPAGQTYYIQAGRWSGGGAEGLHVNVTQVLPPPNDNFASAAAVTSLPHSDTLDMTAATEEPGEPRPSCYYGGLQKTIWYSYTAAANGAVTYRTDAASATAAYTGPALYDLQELGCGYWGYPSTIAVQAGMTYYFQASSNEGGTVTFYLEEAPPPVASFGYSPWDPTTFDTIQFYNNSYDPGNLGIASQVWDFGDGSTSTETYVQHRYAADGNYTVTLTVTTPDGRSGTISQTVQVTTHDVAIIKFTAPQAVRVGQTRQITVGVNSRRYPEQVTVELYRSSPSGYQWVGTLTQQVPVRGGNRTTDFNFSYTFTPDDGAIGKVTFRAVATLPNARDALPADNEAISSPTKVSQ